MQPKKVSGLCYLNGKRMPEYENIPVVGFLWLKKTSSNRENAYYALTVGKKIPIAILSRWPYIIMAYRKQYFPIAPEVNELKNFYQNYGTNLCATIYITNDLRVSKIKPECESFELNYCLYNDFKTRKLGYIKYIESDDVWEMIWGFGIGSQYAFIDEINYDNRDEVVKYDFPYIDLSKTNIARWGIIQQ